MEAAVCVLNILCLPQAIDCDGGLVNAVRSRLPCGTLHMFIYIFVAKPVCGLFCYKTKGAWVRWNLASSVISIPLNFLYSSHRKGDHLQMVESLPKQSVVSCSKIGLGSCKAIGLYLSQRSPKNYKVYTLLIH